MDVLTQEQYEHLRVTGTVTAADPHGEKVLLLADGTYLKLFRVKRLFTSARLFPYWRRFEVNAGRLAELGVPTLKVLRTLEIPHLDRTAVHYEPLPGRTLREVDALDGVLVEKLGRFIVTLHDRGVYLRSMHLGNVVLTPEGEFGLIDVADMKVRSRALPRRLRVRNYRHMARYDEDREVIYPWLDEFTRHLSPPLINTVRSMFSR